MSARSQTFYLIRHAESAMSGRYCGSTDAALSRKGRLQAARIAGRLADIPLKTSCFSDLKRAKQTASYFHAGKKLELIPSKQLREIHFGKWEGNDYASVASRWPALYSRWIESPMTVRIPSGETFAHFAARVADFSAGLKRLDRGHVAITGHGGSLAVLHMILLRRPFDEFWKWVPPVASISVLKKKKSRFELVRLHDTSHLAS